MANRRSRTRCSRSSTSKPQYSSLGDSIWSPQEVLSDAASMLVVVASLKGVSNLHDLAIRERWRQRETGRRAPVQPSVLPLRVEKTRTDSSRLPLKLNRVVGKDQDRVRHKARSYTKLLEATVKLLCLERNLLSRVVATLFVVSTGPSGLELDSAPPVLDLYDDNAERGDDDGIRSRGCRDGSEGRDS